MKLLFTNPYVFADIFNCWLYDALQINKQLEMIRAKHIMKNGTGSRAFAQCNHKIQFKPNNYH